jgi:hypothetical protein
MPENQEFFGYVGCLCDDDFSYPADVDEPFMTCPNCGTRDKWLTEREEDELNKESGDFCDDANFRT